MIEIKRKRAYQLQSAEKRPSNKSEFFLQILRWLLRSKPKNPFSEDSRQPRFETLL
jgi:hypothetical protein